MNIEIMIETIAILIVTVIIIIINHPMNKTLSKITQMMKRK